MNKEKNRFNVEEHTTLDNKIIDVFPISHRYIHNLEQQVKKQQEVIDKAIKILGNYRHYYIPDEEQNSQNEQIVDKSYNDLQQENQLLKKQLEEKEILVKQCDLSIANMMDCYCERTDCAGRIKDSKKYDSLVQKIENQQKEFIKWLEDEIKHLEHSRYISFNEFGEHKLMFYKEILQKYKEIVNGTEQN